MAKQISEAALDAKSKIQMTTGDKVLNGIFYAFIALFAVICLVPFILVVSASFTQEQALTTYGYALWPREFSLDAYRLVVAGSDIPQAYLITIFTTVFGTFLSMLVTCMVAYALSLQSFRSRSALALFIYFTMLFNGGMIPNYILISRLGLIDSRLVMIIPGAINVFNLIVLRTAFMGIPDSLEESARLDGCGNFAMLVRIVLPLSKAILAVLVLYYAVGIWNAYFDALIYLRDAGLYPLQIVLRNILLLGQTEQMGTNDVGMAEKIKMAEAVKYSAIVVSSIPMLLIYPFVQKYFVKGVMIGAVKG